MAASIVRPNELGGYLITGEAITGEGGTVSTPVPRDVGPLDMVFLQDLSGSFNDDIPVLAGLVPDLIGAIRTNIQADSQFGYAAFIDKPIRPFGSSSSDFVYDTVLPITADGAAVEAAIANSVAGDGRDLPESQLDALFLAAVRADEVGYRAGTERFIVLTTDAEFHVAGDGLAAGIDVPNNGDAVLDGTPPGTGEDYVSIDQVRSALEAANITPIFAVTTDVISDYTALRDSLGRGVVVELEADSSNIVSAVSTGLETIITGADTGADAGAVNVEFKLEGADATFVNELGVFLVDDAAGTIGGLSPDAPGYLAAALERGQVVFTSLANNPLSGDASRILSLPAGGSFGFYTVADGSTEEARRTLASGGTPQVNLSFPVANAGDFDNLRDSLDGELRLEWEDIVGGGDSDFNDLVLTATVTDAAAPLGSGAGELINLSGVSGPVEASFTIGSDAGFANTVGFYAIDDLTGAITDAAGNTLRPGDAGYAAAAIASRVVELSSTATDFSLTLEGGSLLAPFIIADGTVDEFLSGADLSAYFSFTALNSDGVDHVRLLGDNTFGFEDLAGGGDRDFNDMVIRAEFVA